MVKTFFVLCIFIFFIEQMSALRCKTGENNIVGFRIENCKQNEKYCYDVQCKNRSFNTRMKGCTNEPYFCDYAKFGCTNTLTDVQKNNCRICTGNECNSKT